MGGLTLNQTKGRGKTILKDTRFLLRLKQEETTTKGGGGGMREKKKSRSSKSRESESTWPAKKSALIPHSKRGEWGNT